VLKHKIARRNPPIGIIIHSGGSGGQYVPTQNPASDMISVLQSSMSIDAITISSGGQITVRGFNDRLGLGKSLGCRSQCLEATMGVCASKEDDDGAFPLLLSFTSLTCYCVTR